MSFKLAVLSSFLLISLRGRSQTSTDAFIEQLAESVVENTSDDFDYSELVERLENFRKHPLNLNSVSAEQLQELIFISPLQANAIINHRNMNGKFLDILELQSVDALDVETLKRLATFCTLKDPVSLSSLKLQNRGSHEMIFTYGQVLQKQKGYQQPENSNDLHYAGSPQRFLTRYKYNGQVFSASVTMEKDAGEVFLEGSNTKGFDFYSGNISVRNVGIVKRLVIGDYSLQFGQGLTMWSGLSFGKGAAVATITKNDIGLKPYTSTNESLFLRGIASTIHLRNIDFTSFISYRYIDGNLELSGENTEVSSTGISGLHRTQSEIDNRNTIRQRVYGTNFQYAKNGLRLGGIVYRTMFNYSFEPGSLPYNRNEFSGNRLTNLGAYYNYTLNNLYLFGETGHSINSGYAFLHGLMASLSPKVALILFHRDYQKNYHSFFNQAVSEGTKAVNEKGFYSGLVISPNKKAEINIYADLFKFPWLRFRVDAPSSGYEMLTQFSYSISKRIKITGRYKLESKEENDVFDNAMNHLAEVRKQNFRLEISFHPLKNIQFRNRLEAVLYKKENLQEQGSLIYQDILYNPVGSRFSGNIRLAMFDTPGFNSRVYAFENDVLYNYTMSAYQHQGLRFYLNLKCRINRSAEFWLKYANSSYTGLESIGSGFEEISGNQKSDLKFQFRFRF